MMLDLAQMGGRCNSNYTEDKKMKLTKKLCRDAGIINGHDYANGQPYLFYSPQSLGRISYFSAWKIVQKNKSFSDYYRDYGAMCFNVYHRADRQEIFNQAINWMRQKFGYAEIVKTPVGSWMEKSFVKKRNQEIINALKQGISLREK